MFDSTDAFPAANDVISIHGAREHNLKNLSLAIPRNQFVVITGVSGSGKSTLAFDLLFAEGQRRFLDSMNVYARQFVEQLARPDVDLITGIPPTVSIEQRNSRGGGKSTVATVTEIHHFIRLLFARLGTQYCPDCQLPVEAQTRDRLGLRLKAEMKRRGDLLLLAPMVRNRKGFHTDVAEWAAQHGYAEVRADGKLYPTSQRLRLDRFREHDVEIVVGVLEKKPRRTTPPAQALIDETLKLGRGTLFALDNHGKLSVHSTERACPKCGRSFAPLDPKMFSYNSSQGWCPKCRGFGELFYLPDVDRGARAEAIEESWFEWQEGNREPCPDCHGARLNPLSRAVRLVVGPRSTPNIDDFANMPVQTAANFFRKLKFRGREATIARDILPEIRERLKFLHEVGLGYPQLGRGVPTLSGGETQRIRLAAQLGSNLSGVLYVLDEPTIGLHARDNEQLLSALQSLKSRGNSVVVVEHDEETMRRADHIIDLGPGAGVHGGKVVASGTLAELMLHEDSVTGQCLRVPKKYPARGTRRPIPLIPVAADVSRLKSPTNFATRNLSRHSDAMAYPRSTTASTSLSPTGGPRIAKRSSLVGQLNGGGLGKPLGRGEGASHSEFRSPHPALEWLVLRDASVHNLKNLTVRFPLNRLVVVTGVSGSGKSTLIRECLFPAVQAAIKSQKSRIRNSNLPGSEFLQAVYEVDQSPIGRTPRSIPATYVGFFDLIRQLFAQIPEARLRGYSPSRFSFNSAQGRCPQCEGAGEIKMEMNFLPPAFVRCEVCGGSRFNRETLDIEFNGKNIAQVLEMSVEEALAFFAPFPRIKRPLQALCDTGLDYLKLGQTSPTLSGGEAQRVKLVSHLLSGLREPQFHLPVDDSPSSRPSPPAGERVSRVRERMRGFNAGSAAQSPKHNLFILEEPTIGLHIADVRRLVDVLQRLVDSGHSVIVIEHNLDLIAEADWVIDLGPEGGDAGGYLVVEGPPEQIATHKLSHTGRFLRSFLAKS